MGARLLLALGALLALLLPPAARAQTAPPWAAALAPTQASGAGSATINATAVNAAGDVFITGIFSGQVRFGTATLTSAGNSDGFVAKWNTAAGTWAWAAAAGGLGVDESRALAVSGSSVYLTGYIQNSSADANAVRFGGVPLPGASFANTQDVFVARYTDAGTSATYNWATVGGGTSNDQGYGIAASGSSVYLTGYCTNNNANGSAVQFSGVALPGTSVGNNQDVFVVKYTDAGTGATYNWGVVGGGTGIDEGRAIAVSGSSVYLTGYCNNNTTDANAVRFSGISLPGASTTSSPDVFVAKYTDAGTGATCNWAAAGGGIGNDFGRGIAVSGTGVYLTGNLNNNAADANAARFGGMPLPGASATNGFDVFVAKYTDAGTGATYNWATAGGGTAADEGRAIAVSGSSVYLTGYTTNTAANGSAVQFGGVALPGTSTSNSQDVFVAKYTDAGTGATCNWATAGGGTGADVGAGIAVSGSSVQVGLSSGNAPALFGAAAAVVPSAAGRAALDAATGSWQNTGTAVTATGTSVVRATAVNAAGDVFITGTFSGQVGFGTTTLASTGNSDVFVAKWSPATNTWAWAVAAGGTGNDEGRAIAVSGTSVYLTGSITNTAADVSAVRFGGIPLPGTSSNNLPDMFVAKYTDAGTGATCNWATAGGGSNTDEGRAIAVSGTSVYLTGSFQNTAADANAVRFGGVALPGASASNSLDVFVARYTDVGTGATCNWATAGGGSTVDVGQAIAVSGTGVYLTGYIQNTAANGSAVQFSGVALPGNGTSLNANVFVAKYTDAGALGWVTGAGGTSTDQGQAIAVSGGSVYLTGFTNNNSANTSAVQFGGVALPGNGTSLNFNVFVARYADTGALGWVTGAGGNGADQGLAIAVSGGSVYLTGFVTNNAANTNLVRFLSVDLPGLGASNSSDAFVVKYTDAGSTIACDWAVAGGGSSVDQGQSLAVSGTGVYVAGLINPPATFGATTLSPAGQAAFAARLVDIPPPPVLSALAPASGPAGSQFALTGTFLTGATAVTFTSSGGTATAAPAGYVVASSTSITGATVPAGLALGAYTVTVTTPGGTSNGLPFEVTVPEPSFSGVTPNPGGRGQVLTLSGTSLGNPTALTVNGADALAGILSNTGRSVVVRVPAAAATGSGSIALTTAFGTATAPFAVVAPPGNALALDGSNDFLSFDATPAVASLGAGAFTLEAWVYYDGNTGGNPIVRKIGDYGLHIINGRLAADVWPSAGNVRAVSGSVPVPANRWTHVAATWNSAGTAFLLYVNGVPDAATTTNTGISSGTENLHVGGSDAIPGQHFRGRLDEVRIYNAALTPANIVADMTSDVASVPASLRLHLNFDQGTPATASTGDNAGLITLYDLVNGYAGTLTNLALTSGNTTSNYVESYAQVLPTATPATVITSSGFTANWTAPALGTANTYEIEVATNADFTAGLSSRTVAATATNVALTGLVGGTTYYYRVRADKTSVTGQGGYSNPVAVTLPACAAPVALAQSASVSLDVNGNATLTAAAVNNGSTADCAAAPAGALSVSPSLFSCADAVPPTVAGALHLNGSGQYLSVAAGNAMPIGNDSYTLEAWIKPANMGAYGIIGWGNYGTGPQVNALRLFNDFRGIGLVHYWWGPDILRNTADLSGAWHHVAASYDAAANTRTLYLDGVAIATDNPGPHAVPNADNLTIGKTVGTEFFNGSLDEVRVWSVARTAAQINAAKGIGLPGGTSGLVAYYRFNEGSGTLVNDATGAAANQASFVGSPTWTTDAAPVTNGVPVTLTVTDAGGNTATAPAVVTVSVPPTPTTTWNGSLSTAPLACQNWSFGKVPDATTDVVVPAGQARYPVVGAGTVAAKNLTVASGASLTTNAGTTLQVSGDLTDNGTTTLNGTVAFVGSAATQTLSSGTVATLVVNKPAGTVQLARNLAIGTALTLSSGTLTTTGAYQVDLGGSAVLSESSTGYVVGKAVVNRTLVPGTAQAFGGLGLTLTPAAGSTAPGATLVSRVTGTALTGTGSSQSIRRYYDIQPAVNAGLNVTMDFRYFDHELNGIAPANLALFESESSLAGPWAPQGGVAGPNVVTKTGITDFSIWTLGSRSNPLPVALTAFSATATGHRAVRLAWVTATETNSARFEVERSLDGSHFAPIGTVAAAGHSSAPRRYELLDAALPTNAVALYYRLRQVDQDDTFSHSPVRVVTLTAPFAATSLTLAPNPSRTTTLAGAPAGAAVAVYDALGRQVLMATADATGTALLVMPGGCPAGVYVVRTGTQAVRLLVE
ncbi:hypothetical protein GCM10023186_14870 [Hymenobacter koreensis]|uniref:Fibronectin type-III domain-containing protein n=1 Tax=Hymenobacter koreensis TaxID=1084523 RepID=A0ABP8IY55_9BACT